MYLVYLSLSRLISIINWFACTDVDPGSSVLISLSVPAPGATKSRLELVAAKVLYVLRLCDDGLVEVVLPTPSPRPSMEDTWLASKDNDDSENLQPPIPEGTQTIYIRLYQQIPVYNSLLQFITACDILNSIPAYPSLYQFIPDYALHNMQANTSIYQPKPV